MLKNFSLKKSFPIVFVSIFAVLFLVQMTTATILLFMPAPAQAAGYSINLQVPIPTFRGGQTTFTSSIKFNNSTAPIAQYIMLIYTFAVSAVGIVAAVVLMIGGLMWITAGGNASNVSEAKSMITASITGLILVLTSYLILNQVNPGLVNLQPTEIAPPNVKQTTTGPGITAPDLTKCTWTPQNSDNIDQATGKMIPCSTGLIQSPFDSITNTTPGCTNPPPVLNNCCCQPIAAGSCPVNSSIACQSCPDCVLLTGQSGLDAVDCKSPNTCEVVPGMLEKLQTLSAELQDQGMSIEITEAWPPSVNHASIGHQNGTCIDLVPSDRSIDNDTITALNTDLKDSGFSQVLYECYQNNPSYSGMSCSQTETGAAAGGNNHFHVCN